ncbi:hypothetical protein [Paucibacter sp. XJ19-41]|uniref:hypothetical protein n=1 Tax=Paucibacter sp. XJ19-41 TaxID=2927824 RepID=UPI00234B8FFA|nr:hypothetical protein [Paucibacter sp. XJ19-41]MDC6169483.1 hypothetical protein [Paucibacter sp. XJ19-41]
MQSIPQAKVIPFAGRGQRRNARLGEPASRHPPHMVPVEELLTPSFLIRHTGYDSLPAFLSAGGISMERLVSLGPHSAAPWDDFIRLVSVHPGWPAMLREAGAEWMMRRLGLVVGD